MKKLKKKCFIFSITVMVIAVAIFSLASPIAKYLIQQYDEKYTGRQITLDYAYANPFTGYIHLSNLKIFELKSDSVFLSLKGVSANIALLKLFSKTFELSELNLDHPRGIIHQNKMHMNFNDLIEKFSTKKDPTKKSKRLHLNILNIQIKNGEFHYRENIIPISYFIKDVNIDCKGWHWDEDTMVSKFSFVSGIGSGDMKGDITVNIKNNDYRLAVVARKYDLNIIGQYLKDLTNQCNFSANIDADFRSNGNFIDREAVTNSGLLTINDFHFGKNIKEDYAAFEKAVISIKQVTPKKRTYQFDSVSISKPYLKYERYDYLDNLQTIFGKGGAKVKLVAGNPEKFNLIIEIVRYVKIVSKNFFRSDYKINRLAVYKAKLSFCDFSRSEKFSADLEPLYLSADSIDKRNTRVKMFLKSGIKPYGNMSVDLSINPKDSSDFDLVYNFNKLPLAILNPYTVSYTSFPFDRGTINIKGEWNVRNGNIHSKNHLVIIDPRVSNRTRNKDLKWMPMRLILFVIRERGNVVDYVIPITGNLKSPKFHFKDIVTDAFENIFVKPVTTPYRMEVRNTEIEIEIENFLSLKWELRQSTLLPKQINFLKKLANFLKNNPKASISIYPQYYSEKEKEYILLYEAKKMYYLESNHINKKMFSESDSEKVVTMSIKDSLFIQYLNNKVKHQILNTVQDKCTVLIGNELVKSKFDILNEQRVNSFINYFKQDEINNQINVHPAENVIPYNGFSFYKMEYKGIFPKSLLKAYDRMNDLNNETPRKKFKSVRRKNKGSI